MVTEALAWCTYFVATPPVESKNYELHIGMLIPCLEFHSYIHRICIIHNSPQVLQLTAMPTLAEAVVESFSTMLDAEELSLLFSAAQTVELESTAANTVEMLESDVQVVCN